LADNDKEKLENTTRAVTEISVSAGMKLTKITRSADEITRKAGGENESKNPEKTLFPEEDKKVLGTF
jgi:hypothetical protein